MKVKEESGKLDLKLNIQKIKIMASGPITSWQIDRETMKTVRDFIFGGSKMQMVTAVMKLKDACSLGFPGGSDGKVYVCNAGDLGSILGLGRFPAKGNGKLLQYSCLENPMDGGAWCRLLSMGSQRVRHNWATSLSFTLLLERKVIC